MPNIQPGFNPLRGKSENLPIEKVDGNVYFCTDNGSIHMDYKEGEELKRVSLKSEPGPKGDKGDPGVYVGEGIAPEGTKVQVDPSSDGNPFFLPEVLTTTGPNEHDTMSQKAITDELNKKVQNTLTINKKPLTSDIDLTAEDLGALKSPEVPGTEGQFAVFDINGNIKGVSLIDRTEVGA